MYGEYSAIAHGSDTPQARLLGEPVTVDLKSAYSVFPKFSPHAYVLAGHVALSVVELDTWLADHAESLGWPIDWAWFEEWWARESAALERLVENDPYGSAQPVGGSGDGPD
jgi:hypothetical protein